MPPWLAEPLAALRTTGGDLEPLLAAWWPALAAALLALLFLALWLRARARPGDPELREQLRAAKNEIKLLKGDLIHARRSTRRSSRRSPTSWKPAAAAVGAVELEPWRDHTALAASPCANAIDEL